MPHCLPLKSAALAALLLGLTMLSAVVGPAGVCQAELLHRYSFNDGTANDSVGGANGLLVNGATVTGGQVVFDPSVNSGSNLSPATGQYVDLPDTIGRTRALTLEIWTTWRGGASWQRMIDFGNCTAGELLPTDKTTTGYTGGGFIILTHNSGGGLLGQISINSWGGANTDYVAASTGLSIGVEHHVVYTHDPDIGLETLYIDGQQVGQKAATVDPSTTNYLNHFLGRSNFYQDPFYNGTINEFRIYDSYLTAQDVLADYQDGPNASSEPVTPSMWLGSSGGSWSNAANWSQGVPNAAGAVANFTGSGGSLAKIDGTITVGALNFSGATGYDIQPGTGTPNLAFSNTAGNAVITLSGDAAAQTVSAPVSLSSDLTVTSNANGLTMSGGISGSGRSVTLAAGLLVLQGANTYTGNTNVTGGTLRMGAASAAAPGSMVVLSPGATVDLNSKRQVIGGLSGAGGTVTSAGEAALTINQAGNATYGGQISGGSLSVVKSGAGTLTLTSANSYGGGSTLTGGKLVLSNSSGSALGSGNLVLNGGTLASGSVGALTGDVLASSGAHVISPGDHGSVGVLRTGSLFLTSSTTLDFSDIAGTTVLDQILSTGSLNFSGGGTAAISLPGFLNAGTYKLIDFTSAGTALAGNFSMPGAPSRYSLQMDGTSYDLDLIVTGGGSTANNWIGASGAAWTSTGNWSSGTIPNGQGAPAAFVGSGGATVSVSGTVTVGSMTFAGPQSYNIASGTSPALVFNNAAGNATILVDSGTAAQTIATPVTLNSDLAIANSSTTALTFSGGISGTGKGINLTAGLLALQGTNTYTGNTSVGGGTLRMGGAGAAASGSTVVLGPGATVDLNSYSQTIGGLSGTGGTVTSAGAATLTINQAGNTTYSGRLSGALAITKSGAGTLTLANTGAANNWTGGVLTVSAGALANGAPNQIPDGVKVTVASGATWDLNGCYEKITDLTYTAAGTVNLNGGTLELTSAQGGSGMGHRNNITGAGTLILSGGYYITDNTTHLGMTGSIYITGGARLTVGHGDAAGTILASDIYVTDGRLAFMNTDNRLSPTVQIHMSSGGTVLMKQDQGWSDPGTNQTVAVLEGAGGTVNNNDTSLAHTLTVNQASGTYTFGGTLTNEANALNIVKSGTGTWVLTGANTHTGSTTVSGGVLRANSGTGLPVASALVLGGGVLEGSGTTTFTRSLGASGSNTVRWTASGGFSANGGKMTVAIGGTSSPTALTWGSGSFVPVGVALVFGSTTADSETEFKNNLNLAGAARTIIVNDNPTTTADFATISGVLSNGSLVKAGAGLLVLRGSQTYTGPTSVNQGSLIIGAGGSLASSSVTVAGGATFGGSGTLLGTLVAGGVVAPGSSPGILTVEDITFNSTGTLQIELGGPARGTEYDVLAASGTVTLQSGSTLAVTCINGFVPQWKDEFDILDFAGVSGQFSTLDLPQLGEGLSWDTSDLYTGGTIMVAPEPASAVLFIAGLTCAFLRRRRTK